MHIRLRRARAASPDREGDLRYPARENTPMPFCHIHGVPLLIDPYGNPTCERCERSRKADQALRCRECNAPTATPGLCPSCGQVAGRRRIFEWLGANAGWLTLVILLLGLALFFLAFALDFLPAVTSIKESPAYRIP